MRAANTHVATISIRLLWPFLKLAREQDLKVVCQRLGLTQAELNDPDTRVPQKLVAGLLQAVVEATGERDIGLLAAHRVESLHFGIGEYIARTQRTLRDAAELYSRYLPLLSDGAGLSVEGVGPTVTIRFWFSSENPMPAAAYEFAVAIGVLRARRVTGVASLAPLSVHFTHPSPADTARHDDIFRCPVHFGADTTCVVLLAKRLSMPLPGNEPVLGELLKRQADAMLEKLPRRSDATSQVRALLGCEIAFPQATVSRLAKRLGLSTRTFARKLESEGTSFRALFDEARKQAALRELAQNQITIAELAHRLGFASTHSFHRAFKRWTGTTAGKVRRS
jgi:AraC-like DNA-binding protein